MDINALTDLARVTSLSSRGREYLKQARLKHIQMDEKIEREVMARIPDSACLNRVVNMGIRHEH